MKRFEVGSAYERAAREVAIEAMVRSTMAEEDAFGVSTNPLAREIGSAGMARMLAEDDPRALAVLRDQTALAYDARRAHHEALMAAEGMLTNISAVSSVGTAEEAGFSAPVSGSLIPRQFNEPKVANLDLAATAEGWS